MVAQVIDTLIGILIFISPILLFAFLFVYVLKMKSDKKALIRIVVFMSMILFICFQSDFVKSRKTEDLDWMIGKTIDTVRWRYSYPSKSYKYQETKIIDDREYVFCSREIFEWNFFDGVLGEIRYYVYLDESGNIADVKYYEWGGFAPASEYPLSARW